LEKVLDVRERRIALERGEHIRLDDPDIDPSREDDIGDVLKCALTGYGKNPQVVLASIETGRKIGSFAKIGAVHAS
jgi:hypothetical protein